ncbi:seryl-tRNA synthetase [Fontibacillus panacisegetis]|uniref:Serine--tRNA ligase n=1 Tax=Fontibacillus panacisegetis TaxID=670482 RepID=A0A1G7SJV6_9BACL|nr:serine--tRNA ligase [Fontibacillus panacisegetis]SDG23241.1 seryl-tRNA synthetase [Fontibacillus panacisegetis]
MLDIQWIRANAAKVQEAAAMKGIDVSVEQLLNCDDTRRKLLYQSEQLRQQRNEGSRQVALLRQNGNDELAIEMSSKLKQINMAIEKLSKELDTIQQEYSSLMLLMPNVPSSDSPIGTSDADNVIVRQVGELPQWSFKPRDHVELGTLHGMIDIPRGVKTGGSRSYFLKGDGYLYHRAVQQLAMDLLMGHGFIPFEVPLLVKEERMVNTGYFPTGRDQAYAIKEENLWLAGTSEVPLVSYFADEIVDVKQPLKLAAISTCFRSEVGSAGRDVRGLYRVHQFSKVEMVVICEPDSELSDQLHREITQYSEELLGLLELPYRVMAVCVGDMSQKTYKQYDIETWMPGREAYGETHSSSNLGSFQARRSNIRCRDEEGKTTYCHTLNNTAAASPRILIPLLENHQREDGSIYVPKALRKYMGDREMLIPVTQ